jgi:hypothetical protein
MIEEFVLLHIIVCGIDDGVGKVAYEVKLVDGPSKKKPSKGAFTLGVRDSSVESPNTMLDISDLHTYLP